ncbi:MAG TPA: glycosyltransferase [Thermoanaerobaculia bacterium]|nr:glycosyltransferase [Thermoanaerobaculia bacterium]
MSPGTGFRVLLGEGVLAVRDRALDRLAEARRRRSFRRARAEWRADCPVLTVGAYPPAPRFGGVQAQWMNRLAAEEALRPVASLYPDDKGDGGYRLEVSTGPGGERRALHYPGRFPAPRALRDPDFEDAVAWAAERVGARALQVEGAAGLPPASLLRLAQDGLPLVLALHDFALFCPRPHLLEEPFRRFCGYCRDLSRCAACLGEAPELQARWREAGSALLAAATAVVFPSAFLERTHAELFGPLAAGPSTGSQVIPPAILMPGVLPGAAPAGPIRHLALVGGVQAHKGAEVFREIVEQLAAAGRTDLSWSAYGGGDPALLARLRHLGGRSQVRVRGYYRTGSLPRLLRRDRVDLALLPSIVPESFSLVLSECRAAGVPVLAFDLGAVGERLRAEGGGLVVPLAEGAAGMAALAAAVGRGERIIPPLAAGAEPSPREIAGRWLSLYRDLGFT